MLERFVHRGESAFQLVVPRVEVRSDANPGAWPEVDKNVAREEALRHLVRMGYVDSHSTTAPVSIAGRVHPVAARIRQLDKP
jgi:hypothetical protein